MQVKLSVCCGEKLWRREGIILHFNSAEIQVSFAFVLCCLKIKIDFDFGYKIKDILHASKTMETGFSNPLELNWAKMQPTKPLKLMNGYDFNEQEI